MSRCRFVALALIGVFCWCGSAQSEGFVEGHVFNLRTGVPVANAQVLLLASVLLPAEGCENNCASRLLLAFTDDSGFYSVHFSDREVDLLIPANVTISARCPTQKGDVATGATRPVDVRDGTVRRDLYLPLPLRPRVRTCSSFFALPAR